ATTIPVALAIAATERSISAHRITKVSPTAITPATEICTRILAALSSVAKDGLATPKKTSSTIRVANGAMLRIWPRRNEPSRDPDFGSALTSDDVVMPCPPSCSFQQTVFADRLPGELANDLTLPHHHDPISERQYRLGL